MSALPPKADIETRHRGTNRWAEEAADIAESRAAAFGPWILHRNNRK
jgi:hypothetical protein